jgi:hypothetical protein
MCTEDVTEEEGRALQSDLMDGLRKWVDRADHWYPFSINPVYIHVTIADSSSYTLIHYFDTDCYVKCQKSPVTRDSP